RADNGRRDKRPQVREALLTAVSRTGCRALMRHPSLALFSADNRVAGSSSASSRVSQIFILIHWIKIDSRSLLVSLAPKASCPKKKKEAPPDKEEGTVMSAQPRLLVARRVPPDSKIL